MDTQQCLEAAARIEVRAQELYSALAVRYEDRPELRDLFLRLAAEEEQHAYRIRTLARHDPGTVLWDEETIDPMARLLGTMEAEIQALAAEEAARGEPGDPRALLVRMIDFERRFASVHAEHLAMGVDPDVEGLFAALARQDQHHRQLLEKALRS